jgi:hypothetical protein
MKMVYFSLSVPGNCSSYSFQVELEILGRKVHLRHIRTCQLYRLPVLPGCGPLFCLFDKLTVQLSPQKSEVVPHLQDALDYQDGVRH